MMNFHGLSLAVVVIAVSRKVGFLSVVTLSMILLIGLCLVESVNAGKESRPFWTEKSAFIEGDDLLVVGVATKSPTVEEGRRQAFEQGKIELMNYAQVTSLEAQGLVIETQVTYEEVNPDGTVTVYRLLRVPASKLKALQNDLQAKSIVHAQAIEDARSELLSIQNSLQDRSRKLDEQQRQVTVLLGQLRSQLAANGFTQPGQLKQAEATAGSLSDQIREVEVQMAAREDELQAIERQASIRLAQERNAFRYRCKHLVIGMTKEEIKAVLGNPSSKKRQRLDPNISGDMWWYTGANYQLKLDLGQVGTLKTISHRDQAQEYKDGCP